MTTGSIVTNLHEIWLKQNRAQIDAGASIDLVISKLRTHRIEQCEAGRMNMAATIDAVIFDLQHDDAMLGA